MDEVPRLRTMADYQFGGSAGDALLHGDLEFRRSNRGRVTQVFDGELRLASVAVDGRFTLSFEGANRLHSSFDAPTLRVEFGEESVPYIEDGRNGFAKFVRSVDPDIRSRDEVLVTGPDDELLAAGRAELSAVEMEDFGRGVAVSVRDERPEDEGSVES